MDKYNYDVNNRLWYEQTGNYYLPFCHLKFFKKALFVTLRNDL